MIRVFIENEAGSDRKNTYDETTLAWLSAAKVSARYPFPYGFVVGTRGGDGDAVDCFVVTDAPLAAGSIVECRAVGLLEQIEDGEIDHKVLAALPATDPVLDAALHARLRSFVTSVFRHVPGKDMRVGGILGTEDALDFIDRHSL